MEMNSAGVQTVRQCRLRTRPRLVLIGAMRSPCSLSHEIVSRLSVVLDPPIRMKIALMLAAIACSKWRVLMMLR